MEFSIHNLDHADKIFAGFESMLLDPMDSNDKTQYLGSALKLNGLDIGQYDGSESFFGKIKETGIRFYEYVKRFLKSIWDWFFSPKGEKVTKTVDHAVNAVTVASKSLPKKVLEQPPEVQEEVTDKISDALETPSKFHIKELGEKFTHNKNGVFTDIRKTAQTLQIDIPDFEKEFADIEKYQKAVTEELGAKRAKSGDLHGFVNTMSEATFMCTNYKGLRNTYLTLAKKLEAPTAKANELTKELQGVRNNGTGEENLYRQANKVLMFLTDFDRSVVKALNNCSRNVKHIADAIGSVYVLIDYNATEKRFLEEMNSVEILDTEER